MVPEIDPESQAICASQDESSRALAAIVFRSISSSGTKPKSRNASSSNFEDEDCNLAQSEGGLKSIMKDESP
jgi:hypothetical protein